MATKLKFVCEHCDKVLSVSADKVGARGKCPQCKQSIKVPSESVAAEGLARYKEAKRRSREEQPPGDQQPGDQPQGDPFSEFAVYDFDSELVYDTEDQPSPKGKPKNVVYDHDKVAVSRSILYIQGALLAIVALVFFTLGVLVGLGAGSGKSNEPQVAGPCIVTGSVVYKDGDRRKNPDEGAVVIMLPKDAKPQTKAEPYGLRPDEEMPAENHEGLLTIKEIGGDYGRVNENGEYRLNVKNSRLYYVLYISKKGISRKNGQKLSPTQLAQIGNYFLPANELILENKYAWHEARIRGNRKTLPEVVFE